MNEPDMRRRECCPDECCGMQTNIDKVDSSISEAAGTAEGRTPWISGMTETAAGIVPVVKTTLLFSDRLDSWKARWRMGKTSLRITPGLYAVGQPVDTSPVLVSANYKMSFDRLRSQLGGIDAWILVLDTKGINVWCAAGKGAFGTDEIANRIGAVRLSDVVSHRKLIVPQLGAPGIRAHEVRERTLFRVIYGPVRAQHLPAFLDAGMKATPEMRRIEFPFLDRVVLIPNDLIGYAKYALLAGVLFLLLSGFGSGIYSFKRMASYGLVSVVVFFTTYVAGIVLSQALLPWLPGRMFSVKGALVGLLPIGGLVWYALNYPYMFHSVFSFIAWLCIIPAATSFIAMNYTGSSTYTSLSGVLKEMRVSLPIQIGAAFIGIVLWITGLFI